MEKDIKDTPELDSNRTTELLHQIEKEIKRVEQMLITLEAKSSLLDNENRIAYSRARSCLKKYLNILYQARISLTRRGIPLSVIQYHLTKTLNSLQLVFNKYTALFKIPP